MIIRIRGGTGELVEGPRRMMSNFSLLDLVSSTSCLEKTRLVVVRLFTCRAKALCHPRSSNCACNSEKNQVRRKQPVLHSPPNHLLHLPKSPTMARSKQSTKTKTAEKPAKAAAAPVVVETTSKAVATTKKTAKAAAEAQVAKVVSKTPYQLDEAQVRSIHLYSLFLTHLKLI